MSASLVPSAAECFSSTPPYIRVISGQKSSFLHTCFLMSKCVDKKETLTYYSHVPIWTYNKAPFSCYLGLLHILTCPSEMEFQHSQDICKTSNQPQDSLSFYISGCKLGVLLQSLWHRIVFTRTIFMSSFKCFGVFFQKNSGMHWLRIFYLVN